MKNIEKLYLLFLAALFLAGLPLVDRHQPALAETPELATAVFYVQ